MFVPAPKFDLADAFGGLVWAALMALTFPAAFGFMVKRLTPLGAPGAEKARLRASGGYFRHLLYWASVGVPGWVLADAMSRGAKAEGHPEAAFTWLIVSSLAWTILFALLIASASPVRRFFFSRAT